jgi:hypothetical protein
MNSCKFLSGDNKELISTFRSLNKQIEFEFKLYQKKSTIINDMKNPLTHNGYKNNNIKIRTYDKKVRALGVIKIPYHNFKDNYANILNNHWININSNLLLKISNIINTKCWEFEKV